MFAGFSSMFYFIFDDELFSFKCSSVQKYHENTDSIALTEYKNHRMIQILIASA